MLSIIILSIVLVVLLIFGIIVYNQSVNFEKLDSLDVSTSDNPNDVLCKVVISKHVYRAIKEELGWCTKYVILLAVINKVSIQIKAVEA